MCPHSPQCPHQNTPAGPSAQSHCAPLLCLERAQLLGTSQPSRRPPALPAWRSQCPPLLPIRPSSLCQATWQALREVTSRRKCKQSLTHTSLLPVPGAYTERIWLSSSPLALRLPLICPREPGDDSACEDRQGCRQHLQLFSYFPVGAGTFGVPELCRGSVTAHGDGSDHR